MRKLGILAVTACALIACSKAAPKEPALTAEAKPKVVQVGEVDLTKTKTYRMDPKSAVRVAADTVATVAFIGKPEDLIKVGGYNIVDDDPDVAEMGYGMPFAMVTAETLDVAQIQRGLAATHVSRLADQQLNGGDGRTQAVAAERALYCALEGQMRGERTFSACVHATDIKDGSVAAGQYYAAMACAEQVFAQNKQAIGSFSKFVGRDVPYKAGSHVPVFSTSGFATNPDEISEMVAALRSAGIVVLPKDNPSLPKFCTVQSVPNGKEFTEEAENDSEFDSKGSAARQTAVAFALFDSNNASRKDYSIHLSTTKAEWKNAGTVYATINPFEYFEPERAEFLERYVAMSFSALSPKTLSNPSLRSQTSDESEILDTWCYEWMNREGGGPSWAGVHTNTVNNMLCQGMDGKSPIILPELASARGMTLLMSRNCSRYLVEQNKKLVSAIERTFSDALNREAENAKDDDRIDVIIRNDTFIALQAKYPVTYPKNNAVRILPAYCTSPYVR